MTFLACDYIISRNIGIDRKSGEIKYDPEADGYNYADDYDDYYYDYMGY